MESGKHVDLLFDLFMFSKSKRGSIGWCGSSSNLHPHVRRNVHSNFHPSLRLSPLGDYNSLVVARRALNHEFSHGPCEERVRTIPSSDVFAVVHVIKLDAFNTSICQRYGLLEGLSMRRNRKDPTTSSSQSAVFELCSSMEDLNPYSGTVSSWADDVRP